VTPTPVLEADQQPIRRLAVNKQEAHVHHFNRVFRRIAAAAAVGAIALVGAVGQAKAQAPAPGQAPAQAPAAQEKKYKDNAEYEIYNEVTKDFAAKNFAKMITDLDTWKQKYPESDYKDVRYGLYATAYQGANQPAKLMDLAADVLSKDIDATFGDPKEGARQAVTVLYTTVSMFQTMSDPTPAQIATGVKAANTLLAFNRKPAGVADADWATVKGTLQAASKNALLFAAVIPAKQAETKKDWPTASSLYAKALEQYPENAFIAYSLGTAWYQMARADASKGAELVPKAVYEFLRAVAVDPTLGGTQNAKTITDFATKAYVNLHGSDEGIEQVKQLAKATPLPPADFKIKTSYELAAEKENEFKAKYPQLAMWLGIKKELAGPSGPAYFEANLKESNVPKLKGTVVEGKPACNPKELMVSVPEPEQQNAQVVIALKLDAALVGKPEPGEIEFKGVPSAFSSDPFLLTMDLEKTDIEGLKLSKCVATPTKSAPKAKSAPKKK
jgi:hypothetical protein